MHFRGRRLSRFLFLTTIRIQKGLKHAFLFYLILFFQKWPYLTLLIKSYHLLDGFKEFIFIKPIQNVLQFRRTATTQTFLNEEELASTAPLPKPSVPECQVIYCTGLKAINSLISFVSKTYTTMIKPEKHHLFFVFFPIFF